MQKIFPQETLAEKNFVFFLRTKQRFVREIFFYKKKFSFLYPRNLPGVYVIYFPKFNKVYIGESQNVRKRATRQTKHFNVSGSIP